jgi:hypothetical protein
MIMSKFRVELLDRVNSIQRRIQLISSIYVNQMLLLEERFSEDYQDLQHQLIKLKETIRQLDPDQHQQ